MAEPSASSQPKAQELTVDDVITHIVSTTDIKDISTTLLPLLRAIPSATFLSASESGLDPLEQLDPDNHSLGYLYFITARCISDLQTNASELLQRLLLFINSFSPNQIYLAPERYALIVDALSNLAARLDSPIVPVRPLRIAIQRLCCDRPVFTPLHAGLARLALLAKLYKEPLPVLDVDIEDIDPALDVDIENFLSYYYYASMIYIGNKSYGRALELLSVAISAPSQAVSLIQLESYKKYVLVSLLHNGKLHTVPKYTANVVLKSIRRHCRQYIEFAEVYENQNIEELGIALEKRRVLFVKENNFGLASQCLRALQHQRIQGLTQTYITLSVTDIVDKAGFTGSQANAEVENSILEMVQQGRIFASIEHTGQGEHEEMVSFYDNPDSYDTSASLATLNDKIARAAQVGERLGRQDKSTALNRDFLSRMLLMGEGAQMPAMYEDEVDIMVDDDGRLYA
ncbi:COP9 signalosome complex subunit 3 [Umbelopsis sp. WA50703]